MPSFDAYNTLSSCKTSPAPWSSHLANRARLLIYYLLEQPEHCSHTLLDSCREGYEPGSVPLSKVKGDNVSLSLLQCYLRGSDNRKWQVEMKRARLQEAWGLGTMLTVELLRLAKLNSQSGRVITKKVVMQQIPEASPQKKPPKKQNPRFLPSSLM